MIKFAKAAAILGALFAGAKVGYRWGYEDAIGIAGRLLSTSSIDLDLESGVIE